MKKKLSFLCLLLSALFACAEQDAAAPDPEVQLSDREQELPVIDTCRWRCTDTAACSTTCQVEEDQLTCGDYGRCQGLDSDNDGVPDATDNCDYTPNANQADCDGDGIGTACDSDNAIWQQVADTLCFIDKDQHLFNYDIEYFSERRFNDVSSCGSGTKYQRYLRKRADCSNGIPTSVCCISHWPIGLTDTVTSCNNVRQNFCH